MSAAAEFGVLVTETDVDNAVIETLKFWFPTYLRQAERERDLALHFLPRPKADSYANTLDDDEFPDHKLPAVIVTTASADARPIKDGNGNYAAGWTVAISYVTRGHRAPLTRDLASLGGGCVRRLLVQQQDLLGFASEVVWEGSRVAPVKDRKNAGRYLAAGMNEFTIFVDDVLNDQNGPFLPDDPDPIYPPPDPGGDPDAPYDPLALVENVTVEVVGVPVTHEPGD